MTLRDYYETLVEKTANAAEGDNLTEAICYPDSVQAATNDHNRIMDDCRSYLHSTFSQAAEVQKNQSAELKKMFEMQPDGRTITSNPLIKTAFRNVFFDAIPDIDKLKTASPIHQEVAFNAFFDELQKIAQL